MSTKEFLQSFSEAERLQIFTDFFGDVQDIHRELNNLKRERKYRAKVEKLRVERGYVKKKKTPISKAPVPVERLSCE
jgi:glycosylphosphatidylinositol transamidase (GPIT) subunit GPI8